MGNLSSTDTEDLDALRRADRATVERDTGNYEHMQAKQRAVAEELDAFNEAYSKLVTQITQGLSEQHINDAITALRATWPNRRSMLDERLRSDFGKGGKYKTGKACWEQGETYGAQTTFGGGVPDSGHGD